VINIANVLKTLYKTDSLPYRLVNLNKQLIVFFPELSLTITNEKISSESFGIEESLFSEPSIKFGSCESGQIKFTVADIEQDLSGKEFTIMQIVDGIYEMPLGVYKVASAEKQDDLRFKDVIAYDRMKKFDINVADWYNGLSFPMTLKAFRASLCSYIGVTEQIITLPNDNMEVLRTIEPSQISGRVVLFACEEINGAFGHMSRTGILRHVVLDISYGLYPSETLYPSDDLYPVSESDITYFQDGAESEIVEKAMYKKVSFEEYTTKEITKLQIRQEEGDIGVIVGDGSNTYAIEGNFLVYGKGTAELITIATNAFGNIRGRAYRPYEAELIGLPYIEVGDAIVFATGDSVVGYVFNRSMSGIQSLKDTYTAKGTEEIEQVFGVNKEIIQLLGRSAVLKKTIEEVSAVVTNLAESTQSSFIQTADSIAFEVKRAKAKEGELSSSIIQTAESIELKVSKNGIISAINQSAETISIDASKVNITGFVTIQNLATPGATIIDGGNITAGTISGITFNATTINGGTINGAYFESSSWSGNTYSQWENEVSISNGEIRAGRKYYNIGGGSGTSETTSVLKYNSLTTVNVNATTVSATNVNATNIGTSSNPIDKIYFDEIYGRDISIIDSDVRFPNGGSIKGNYNGYVWTDILKFDSRDTVLRGVNSLSLSSPSLLLATTYLGFFGASVTSKRTISMPSTSATLADTITAVRNLMTGLKDYGLIGT